MTSTMETMTSTMETMTSTTDGLRRIGMSLMKSEEAFAAVEYIREHQPDVRIEDHDTFYLVLTEGQIEVDLTEVAEYLGRELPMGTFLGVLSSYFGNIDVQGDLVTVTSENASGMLQHPTLEDFVVSIRSKFGLNECVDWCRSPESRRCWPGTRMVVNKFGTFFSEVEMKAPGVSESVVTVEEHLREPEGDGQQAWFESGLLWYWPTNEIVSAWAEYRFTEAGDGTQIDYRQRYMVPGRSRRVIVNHVRLARSVEKAAQRYLDALASCGKTADAGDGGAPRGRAVLRSPRPAWAWPPVTEE